MNRQMHYGARVDAASLTAQDLAQMSVMGAPQAAAYRDLMAATPRPTGGFTGCGYMARPAGPYNGVSCQYGSLSQYHPNLESFHSDWVANVSYPYAPEALMHPQIQTPGNLPQIFLGGGSGYTPCSADCACSQMNPECKCASPGCGYPTIQQNCMEPVQGGQYSSLAACENARELGYTGPNPALEALVQQDVAAAAGAAKTAANMAKQAAKMRAQAMKEIKKAQKRARM